MLAVKNDKELNKLLVDDMASDKVVVAKIHSVLFSCVVVTIYQSIHVACFYCVLAWNTFP